MSYTQTLDFGELGLQDCEITVKDDYVVKVEWLTNNGYVNITKEFLDQASEHLINDIVIDYYERVRDAQIELMIDNALEPKK